MAKKKRTEEEEAIFSRLKAEEMQKPLSYVPHDTDAMMDDEIRMCVIENGIAIYGVWWCLVELLAKRRSHRYDVTDELGWRFLAADMSAVGETFTADQMKSFVQIFEDHGLLHIDREGDRQFLTNDRVIRTAIASAEKTAQRRLGAALTNGR